MNQGDITDPPAVRPDVPLGDLNKRWRAGSRIASSSCDRSRSGRGHCPCGLLRGGQSQSPRNSAALSTSLSAVENFFAAQARADGPRSALYGSDYQVAAPLRLTGSDNQRPKWVSTVSSIGSSVTFTQWTIAISVPPNEVNLVKAAVKKFDPSDYSRVNDPYYASPVRSHGCGSQDGVRGFISRTLLECRQQSSSRQQHAVLNFSINRRRMTTRPTGGRHIQAWSVWMSGPRSN